jgi:hypothetical protein
MPQFRLARLLTTTHTTHNKHNGTNKHQAPSLSRCPSALRPCGVRRCSLIASRFAVAALDAKGSATL